MVHQGELELADARRTPCEVLRPHQKMGMKLDPEFEAKRDEWLQKFGDAVREFAEVQNNFLWASLSKYIRVTITGKNGKERRMTKKDRPKEIGFFGMMLGASREEATSRLEELGFAPEPAKGKSKKTLVATADGEPVRFRLEFERDKLVRVTFCFSYPPRTHALKTGDFEKLAREIMGAGRPLAHTMAARKLGVRGAWEGEGMISGACASMWRERDEDAKVHTICFDVRSGSASSPKIISKFEDDMEDLVDSMMAKVSGELDP